MSREQERIKKQREKNPVNECNKIQNRFCSDLFQKFDQIKDPRHQSYIEHSNKVMLGTIYFKGIGGITSMHHYLMMQISDMIKQLYEWFYLRANEIKKKQKNISSDLLASFGRQLTREDTFIENMQSIPKT